MKRFFLLMPLLVAFQVNADENQNNQWQPTTLSDMTIKKIQQAKYKYMQCITEEMQKTTYAGIDSRAATDKVIKTCEPSLSNIRSVFTEEHVPVAISDRYLKRTRTQTARKILKQLMFAEAARNMGAATPGTTPSINPKN